MEISDVRRRIQQTIERARREAADRRVRNDEASRAYSEFLEHTAVPLMQQIAQVLKVENYPFTIFTPSGSVRLMSDRSSQDFVEIVLDTSGAAPRVVVHSSRGRGRRVDESERVVGSGDPASVTQEELLAFLLTELEPFVER